MSNNPFLTIDREILADSGTSGESAENLFQLCDQIGPRFAGTEGYRRAAEFMLATFRRYELDNAGLEPFELSAWRRGEPAQLTMTAPLERPYPCYALPNGGGTVPEGIEAEVIDIGPGAKEDVEANQEDLEGRFALTTSRARHRTEVYEECALLGAAGFILANTADGMGLCSGTVTNGQEGTIPAVSIASESASQIQRLAGHRRPRFRLIANASFEPATTWNVVGELRGTELPDELVIMGGHLDSHEIGPGALDNATGAVQVMEAARLLSRQRQQLKRTIRFIGFGAEEVGLLGSHYHAEKHASQLGQARFMLNSDCPPMASPKGLAFHRCPQAEPYVEMLAEQMETPIPFHDRFHCHSDHYPFVLQGLPTAGMAGGEFAPQIRSYGHMAADTPDKISLTDLREGAAFAARILLRAANDEQWPCMRRTPDQVEELLNSH